MVTAGTEHERFTNQFPFWEVNKQVQALNCKVRPARFSYIWWHKQDTSAVLL